MRVDDTKVKLTIHIPFDKPDLNGCVFTKEAIENAVNNLQTNIPIVYRDNECDTKIVGATTGSSHIVAWDSENQVCTMTMDGIVFYSGAEIIVNEIEDGKISDFRIASIGLTI